VVVLHDPTLNELGYVVKQPYPPPSYRHCRVEVEVKHLSRSKQSSAIFRHKCHCYHGQNTVRTPVFILMSNAVFEKKKSGGSRHYCVCQKVRQQPICVFSLFSSTSSTEYRKSNLSLVDSTLRVIRKYEHIRRVK
jgi:hypothetical protein